MSFPVRVEHRAVAVWRPDRRQLVSRIKRGARLEHARHIKEPDVTRPSRGVEDAHRHARAIWSELEVPITCLFREHTNPFSAAIEPRRPRERTCLGGAD